MYKLDLASPRPSLTSIWLLIPWDTVWSVSLPCAHVSHNHIQPCARRAAHMGGERANEQTSKEFTLKLWQCTKIRKYLKIFTCNTLSFCWRIKVGRPLPESMCYHHFTSFRYFFKIGFIWVSPGKRKFRQVLDEIFMSDRWAYKSP